MLAAVFLAIFTLNGPVEAETSITTAFWLALMVLCVISGVIIWYDMPQRLPLLDDEQKAEFHKGQLDFSLIVLATFLTKAGSFLLAAPFLSEVDLGLLRAAERLALLVSFPMLAINPIIAPGIVRLSRGGDAAGLRRLVLRAVTASSGIAACLLLPLLIFPIGHSR